MNCRILNPPVTCRVCGRSFRRGSFDRPTCSSACQEAWRAKKTIPPTSTKDRK